MTLKQYISFVVRMRCNTRDESVRVAHGLWLRYNRFVGTDHNKIILAVETFHRKGERCRRLFYEYRDVLYLTAPVSEDRVSREISAERLF